MEKIKYRRIHKKTWGRMVKRRKHGNLGKTHSLKTKELIRLKKFKGGGINSKGYQQFKYLGRLILQHHYIWCNTNGNLSYIPKGFEIHHIDGNKLNNSPNNLFLISTSDHVKLHHKIRRDLKSLQQHI